MTEIIVGAPVFKEDKTDQMLRKIEQFQAHKSRFLLEMTAVANLDDYKPNWPFLKILKKIYCFSPDIFEILMNLLEIDPRKRHSVADLLKRQLFSSCRDPCELDDCKLDQVYCFDLPLLGLSHIQCKMIKQKSTVLAETISDTYDSVMSCLKNGSWMWICPDLDLNLIIQTMNLFSRLKKKLTDPHHLQSIHQILNSNHAKFDTYLFNVCHFFVDEVINDHHILIRNELAEYYDQLTQQIMDILDYQIKQERQSYHTANQLSKFNTYNVMYNLLYLSDPKIWNYQYNEVIHHLRKSKYQHYESEIAQIIHRFIKNQWAPIKQLLFEYQCHTDIINNCTRHYHKYQKKYDKYRRIAEKLQS